MNFPKLTRKDEKLQEAIDDIFEEMKPLCSDDPEYAKMREQLSELYALKSAKDSSTVDPNAVITVAGSLAGILLIVGFERSNVLTSKALNFVIKPK